MAEWKEGLRKLNGEAYRLRQDILTGQRTFADILREKLPEVERELQKTSPGTTVKPGITEVPQAGD